MKKRSQILGLNPTVGTGGATPEEMKTRGPMVTRSVNSPIGELILGATDLGLCILEFADRGSLITEMATLQKLLCCAVVPGNNPHLEQITDELNRYFNGELTKFATPLERRGTPFQMAVWDELLEIPYGNTISYTGLADRIGRPRAQRAVGRANGANRIAIVIPCHRVVQADGGLRGYGGGVWRKRHLLELERRHSLHDQDTRQ